MLLRAGASHADAIRVASDAARAVFQCPTNAAPGIRSSVPFRLKLKLLAQPHKKGAYQPGLRSPPPSASSAWSDAKELTKTVWSSRLSVACHQRGGK